MPSNSADSESPAVIVARFLRTNGYDETLSTFLEEAGLPIDTGTGRSDALTIETILQEKKDFDVCVNFEKLAVGEVSKRWALPAPSLPTVLDLPTATNLLCTSIERVCLPNAAEPQHVILASTADRRLNVLSSDGELVDSHLNVQDSPILSYVLVKSRWLLCTSMSGKLVVFDTTTNAVVAHRKDHSKYVVQIASLDLNDSQVLVGTIGWDLVIHLYICEPSAEGFHIESPIASIDQPTSPESLLLLRNPEDQQVYLVVARRDSSFLYFYRLSDNILQGTRPSTISLTGKQNLAPLSNAWVAFTPAALAVCPSDPTLIAVATSTVPHMKLLIVRLLFPSHEENSGADIFATSSITSTSSSQDDGTSNMTAARQARIALAIQDRESAAILIQCTTMASQTQYSTPSLAWRPGLGTGIWVNSDDGIIRGIETETGKVFATLEGHEAGSKIRCLWAGYTSGGVECVVSGGFDQRLVLWRPANAPSS